MGPNVRLPASGFSALPETDSKENRLLGLTR